MKIADLDLPTKRLIVCAQAMVRYPSNHHLRKLTEASKEWEEAHTEERATNLIRAIWPKESP